MKEFITVSFKIMAKVKWTKPILQQPKSKRPSSIIGKFLSWHLNARWGLIRTNSWSSHGFSLWLLYGKTLHSASVRVLLMVELKVQSTAGCLKESTFSVQVDCRSFVETIHPANSRQRCHLKRWLGIFLGSEGKMQNRIRKHARVSSREQ